MSIRPIMLMLLALAVAFAPVATRSGAVNAMTPAKHEASMAMSDHCGDTKTPDQPDHRKQGTDCCVAMCAGIATMAVNQFAPVQHADATTTPFVAVPPTAFLAKLPTPPPRLG